jgi:hypothetical protein
MAKHLAVDGDQILSYRRDVQGLNRRTTLTNRSLRAAAWAGLQDSMPRAAVLSIHARLGQTPTNVLDDPSLVQVWGPRYSAYAVAKVDLAIFTLGRFPSAPKAQRRATDTAMEIANHLGRDAQSTREVSRAIGGHHNRLRYAATTGTVVIHWDGARQPTIRVVPAPDVEPHEAQEELARRYLHVFGPATAGGFAKWAGVNQTQANATLKMLHQQVTTVSTPIGEASMLTEDLAALSDPAETEPGVRLLPSGDTYYLLHGDDRDLLIPNTAHQQHLWTSRVWPGALMVDGHIVGTWRRSKTKVSLEPWVQLPTATRTAAEAEAETLPLPDPGPITVEWI